MIAHHGLACALQVKKEQPMDHARAMHLFNCLQDGQVLLLRAPVSGNVFSLQRVWNDYSLPSYTISQNGKPVPDYVGLILGKNRVMDWLLGLEEVNHDVQ